MKGDADALEEPFKELLLSIFLPVCHFSSGFLHGVLSDFYSEGQIFSWLFSAVSPDVARRRTRSRETSGCSGESSLLKQ